MKAAHVLGIKQQNKQTQEECLPCAVKAEAMERTSPPNTGVIKATAAVVTSLLMRLHFKAMALTDTTAHRLTVALISLI